MKTILLIGSIVFIALLFKQPKPSDVDFYKGLWAVQYNAKFNSVNDYKWKPSAQIRYHYIDLDKNPEFKKVSNIKSVPTIIIYRNGVELKRYEAGLLMKLNINQNEIIRNIQR